MIASRRAGAFQERTGDPRGHGFCNPTELTPEFGSEFENDKSNYGQIVTGVFILAGEEVIVGNYRRVNVLLLGQNSEVWEVVELGGHQRYVMKLLLPEKVDIPEQRQMLRHEASVGSKLDHPKIIKFYSYKNDRRNPYILMEYFPSSNLKLRLMRNQFEEIIKPNLRTILDNLAMALSHLHEKRWVHRDVKPDNVLVNAMGDVRLIDFALAEKMVSGFAAMFRGRKTSAGTRSYMSPEQIRGLPLDQRADIYSLGVTIYETVSGKVPFTGLNANELLRKHLSQAPPPIDRSRNVTPEFQDVIMRMLAKNPKDRIQTMDDFRGELRRVRLFVDETRTEPQGTPVKRT